MFVIGEPVADPVTEINTGTQAGVSRAPGLCSQAGFLRPAMRALYGALRSFRGIVAHLDAEVGTSHCAYSVVR
jgi:hypothetical protein